MAARACCPCGHDHALELSSRFGRIRPSRGIPYLLELRGQVGLGPITLEAFAQALATEWRDDDRPSSNLHGWLDLFRTTCHALGRYITDAPDESLLDDELHVWRGVSSARYARGMSWTLDREKAIWFATRSPIHGESPCLYRAHVQREDVLAHFVTRQESEIIIDPGIHG